MARVRIKAEINGKAGDVVLDVSPRVARMLGEFGVGEAVGFSSPAAETDDTPKREPKPVETAAVRPPEQRGASHK